MAVKKALDNVNTEEAKSVGRPAADKPISKMFRVTPQQDKRLREAMYLSGETLQTIVTEGIEMWIAAKVEGKK